ncbi:glycoside hydrolase family 2 protein [Xylariomycetidae sp. FL0641]|nr:glycoside hydrolase family 2 protein [Xylariomycetidae sp. FL0641]
MDSPIASTAAHRNETGLVIRRNARLHVNLQVAGESHASEHREDELANLAKTVPKSLPDWSNVKVIHRNTLPPRSHFYLYNSEQDALSGDVEKSRALLLSGMWGFDISTGPFEGPRDFWRPDFDHTKWKLIKVPGMWQCQGFGKGPQYTNVNYPFPVDPPNVPYDDNECGRYITRFDIPENLKDGAQWRLRFEGVDAAFTVWMNGKEVGYSQGSRNPSEFDVTSCLETGEENTLCVEVYQRCDGSYIEDQDQWWLSGIFRDVWLHSFPSTRLEDYHIRTILDKQYRDACLVVDVKLNKSAESVRMKLLDRDEKVILDENITSPPESAHYSGTYAVKNPMKWTAETPYLYTMILSAGGASTSQKVGFRQAELINGVFCVNGNPVKIRGVNRHEHSPASGRTVPYEFMNLDLQRMKWFNVNAVRTCHYPNDPRFYELANEIGLWVLDEADLECHGFEEVGGDPASYTSDNPEWREAYVDRAVQLAERDKNHPCVVMWSLGNEAFYGKNHQAMYDAIKKIDDTRLIHYEGDQDAKTADIFSRMYTHVDQMIKYAEEEGWKKPFVMCEYIHAMGNGPGGIEEYIEAFYKYPRLMGGFVWEWANHGLLTETKDGEKYFGYGGDFGDDPNDGSFVMDGLCDSTHQPGPGFDEYSKAIEPVQILGLEGTQVTIMNRYDFLTLDHLRCRFSIISDRQQFIGRDLHMPQGVKPHTKGIVALNMPQTQIQTLSPDSWLELEFLTKPEFPWFPPKIVVARGQVRLTPPRTLASLKIPTLPLHVAASRPRTLRKDDMFFATLANGTTFGFDLGRGVLSWLTQAPDPDRNLLTTPMTLSFYRALTDNDRGGPFGPFGPEWRAARLHQTRHHFQRMVIDEHATTTTTTTEDGGQQPCCEVTVDARVAPPAQAWAVDVTTTYTLTAEHCAVRVQARPTGPDRGLPATFARFGLEFGFRDVRIVEWFGRGPGPSYRDMKRAQHINTWGWASNVMWRDFEVPQDAGNRTDVRWVELRARWGGGEADRLLRARFGDHDAASFAVCPYATEDVDACAHPHELRKRRREDHIVRLDWFHHGLGTGSCGPATLPQYQLRTDREFDVEVLLD